MLHQTHMQNQLWEYLTLFRNFLFLEGTNQQ